MYYFDNAASTKPAKEVLETYVKVSEELFANPSSIHRFGERTRLLLDQARQQIAKLLHFDAQEIYFTSSGTESNNWVLTGIVEALNERHPDKKRILISAIEHPSMMRQMDRLRKNGYQVDLIPVDSSGVIDGKALDDLLADDVLLVSTMAVNNEIGTKQPMMDIAVELMHYPNIIWHVDAVQAVLTELDSLNNSRIDVLTLSSHKFHAVRGAGILAKRQRVASYPLLYGGGQEMGERSSTENLAAITAMGKALRMASETQVATNERLADFQQRIRFAFQQAGWQIHTPADHASPHILCVSYEGIPGEVLVHAFAEHDIYLSTTSACSSRRHSPHATLRAMGVAEGVSSSAIRISMSALTTREEVDYLIEWIPEITEQF